MMGVPLARNPMKSPHECPSCGSFDIRSLHHAHGLSSYRCHDCGCTVHVEQEAVGHEDPEELPATSGATIAETAQPAPSPWRRRRRGAA
jgi:predicted RNA-binding Zn-ribbon protein involved in translation (DUF1610 family)